MCAPDLPLPTAPLPWQERRFLRLLAGLCLLALLGYAFFTLQQIQKRGFFEYVGIDFRLFYASGQIWRIHGPGGIYDPALQARYQAPLYEGFARPAEGLSMPFWPLAIPYLPLFAAPFALLSRLPPLTAFGVWVALNGGVTLGYLLLWKRRLGLGRAGGWPVAALFLSSAGFLNLFFGQVNVLLLIAVGEALCNLQQGRPGRAGLWLALGWIKPQMILLLAAVALVAREWRFGRGFGVGSLLVVGASAVLGGMEGLRGVFETLQNWPTALRSSGITWLSAADHLSLWGVPAPLALGVGGLIALGALVVWAAILRVWLGRREPARWPVLFLATLAVETVVMLHGNVHMALALGVPWLVVLVRARDGWTRWLFLAWTLLTGLVFVADAQCAVGHAHNLLGMLVLCTHILILMLLYYTRGEGEMPSLAK